MTIPKRFSEVLEENTPSFRMPKIVSSLGPIRFKTGGLAPGIIVEALVNDERVAHLVATKEANGNYIIDDVHVEPEYRNNGVATALLRTAHETVPMIPYALTDDQVYRSEAGRRLAIKELRIHTAGPLAAIPEIAAVAGEAAGVGEAAAGAGEAAAGASEAASSMPKIKVPSFSGHSTQNNNQDSDDDDDGGQGTTASTTWAIHQATTDPASIPTAILETALTMGALWAHNHKDEIAEKIPDGVKDFARSVKNSPVAQGRPGDAPIVQNLVELPHTVKSLYQKGMGNMKNRLAPKGKHVRQSNIGMELDIVHELQKIESMLKCLCGNGCSSKFNGMPHCLPGEGCCSNAMHGSDSCGSCGNPEAAGSFHNMPLCAPGQGCNEGYKSGGDNLLGLIKSMGCKCGAGCKLGQGCTKGWAPTDETPNEKIQDHDNWATTTNHGEFDMPGPKKPLPPTTWE